MLKFSVQQNDRLKISLLQPLVLGLAFDLGHHNSYAAYSMVTDFDS